MLKIVPAAPAVLALAVLVGPALAQDQTGNQQDRPGNPEPPANVERIETPQGTVTVVRPTPLPQPPPRPRINPDPVPPPPGTPFLTDQLGAPPLDERRR
jgi:hypothetical protein